MEQCFNRVRVIFNNAEVIYYDDDLRYLLIGYNQLSTDDKKKILRILEDQKVNMFFNCKRCSTVRHFK